MALATWWYEDPLERRDPAYGFTVEIPLADGELATVTGLAIAEVGRRRAEGHRPYVLRASGHAVAYGWVASRSAEIGELGIAFHLPAGNRYLWDFVTVPAWRGRGVYPQLLRSIARAECPPATRLWIIHAPENLPSGTGIARAGFEPVAELSFDDAGRPALVAGPNLERASSGAALLGVPLVRRALQPCWRCGGDCTCAPEQAGGCTCYTRPGGAAGARELPARETRLEP